MVIVMPKNEHCVPTMFASTPSEAYAAITLSAQSWSDVRCVHTANPRSASTPTTITFWAIDFRIQSARTAAAAKAMTRATAIDLASDSVMASTPAAYAAGVSDHQIQFSSGIPTTVLPAPSDEDAERLAEAVAVDPDERRAAVAAVVASSPRFLAAWAELGDLGRDPIERYAAYRVGYHRGLDALRANGWRGSGYVRWSEPTNGGFLRSLRGLGRMAAEIGEDDEAERCTQFLLQLDPSGIPDT